ncbi:S-layer homology domain-containing protein [Psychrobacillus sp. INOP01]|uniref:S-layer homology domain-containing protein n=1 Tax=Psychrobacillus sp. INOP01 TaxID=2829187 RepID=UPI001BA7FBF7|nr:S-layer homology domain-containing protein [Psychrobacillus sp. INOP01]QUG41613.1 S-layer homology domain-containing protein [Psychrobacillus sp. INOP01]
MRRWVIMAFGFFAFAMYGQNVQAAEWQQGEVFTGLFDEKVKSTHVLTLEEDARVTFTLRDGKSGYTVILSNSTKQRIASIARKPEAGNKESTVQSVNLKAGTYNVLVSAYFYNRGDYTLTYETSQIEGTDVEPNNEKSEANPYKLGDTYEGALYGMGISSDYDIYKVEIPRFGKVKLHAQATEGTTVNSFGFDMEAVNEENANMFKLKNIRDSNELEVLLQPGTYYFKIKLNVSDQAIAHYTFSTSFEPLDEHVWESGRNLQIASADVLANNITYRGFLYSRGVNYSQSNDYYKFTLVKDAKVMFIANAQKSLGALIFLDEKGSQLSTGGYATSDTRNIVATRVLEAGTYYVEYLPAFGVEGYEEYDLTMRIERFSDVPATHMYYKQIEALAQQGINKGYPDGKFLPNEAIKRKHVFVFLSRIEGLELTKIRTMKTFKDLKLSHPAYAPMKAFYEAGIIDGSGSNMNPESNLTRGQMAKILVNTFDLKMKGEGFAFRDVNSSNGFHNYIQILASNGITIGSNGKFMPNEPITRQHFSVFLHRTLEVIK